MDSQPSSGSAESADTDPSRPVAYDSQGRPLYAAPQPQYVHFRRAADPQKPELSLEVKARHDQSMRAFPTLNLSDAEFVISAVRRHPIGLVPPIGITIFLVAIIVSTMINYPLIISSLGIFNPPSYSVILLAGTLLLVLILLGGYIAVWVYLNNRFFLTNESVIQEIQNSLFSRDEQTVSLINIEDASYSQEGILQNMLNYGSIRLSTEGDETTYRFKYVANPKEQIATLNNAVEAFKNGRPVLND